MTKTAIVFLPNLPRLIRCLTISYLIAVPAFASVRIAPPDSATVVTINGEPVSVREFQRELNAVRTEVIRQFFRLYELKVIPQGFWTSTFAGNTPLAVAKETALNNLIQIKVQQLLFVQNGIATDISYHSFLHDLEEENKRRRTALVSSQVIFGPEQYDEQRFFEYVFSNALVKLKEKLERQEIPLNGEVLQRHDASCQKLQAPINPAQNQDPPNLGQADRFNRQFAVLVQRLTHQAKVEVNSAVYQALTLE